MNCTILTKTGTAQNGSQVDRHSLVAVAMLLLLLISAALANSDYRFQEYDINDGAVPRLNRSIFSVRACREAHNSPPAHAHAFLLHTQPG
jgi:hypothetical protein